MKTIAFIELPCDPGEVKLIMSFLHLKGLPATERLRHFDAVVKNMCSDKWRGKFRKFIEITGSDSDQQPVNEVFEHIQPNLEGQLYTTGCFACHEAFQKLLVLAAASKSV